MAKWITHEPGIYEASDGRKRKKPFQWRQTIRGEKHFESFATLKEARSAKRAKLAEVEKHGSIALQFREDDWRELSQAREKLRPFGVSLLAAVDDFVARQAKGGGVIRERIDRYVALQRARGVGSRQVKNIEGLLAALSGSAGELEPAQVDRRLVMSLLNGLAEAGKSPRTVANHRSEWHAFFQHLADEGAIPEAPTATILARHLPKVRASRKNPLELADVLRIMRFMESERPKWAGWMALQFFLGVRASEASRFRWEWMDQQSRRVVIPGWWFDAESGEMRQGTKTEDSWMIDAAPANLWAWVAKYGRKSGPVEAPFWQTFRTQIERGGVVEKWPHNCRRDSFCTYHMSMLRNPAATALILKHRGTDMLWQSYMGQLRSEAEGRAYFGIYPGFELLAL